MCAIITEIGAALRPKEKETSMEHRIEVMPAVYLTAVQTDKFKTGCFSMNFVRPMCRTEASQNALVPSVLLRGSETYPDIPAISARLDELYGASMGMLVRKKGEVQLTGFYADFVEDALVHEPVFAPALDFVADILLHPILERGHFDTAFLEGEKRNLSNTIAARINDKRSYAVSQLLKTMCQAEPYGVPRLGELEDVATVGAKSLYAHYQTLLASSQVELFYMGRRTLEEAAEQIRRSFANLPRADAFTPVCTKQGSAPETPRFLRETLDVTQGKLVLGLRTNCTAQDEDYPALALLNVIYGAGITSKLFQNVREKLSLCYYAGSSLEKFKGVMLVSAGIEFDKYEIAKDEILRQLDLCRDGEITDEEFSAARRGILSDLAMAQDSPGRLDDFYIGQAVANLSGSISDFADAISRVTKQDVAAAARKLQLDTIYFLEGQA